MSYAFVIMQIGNHELDKIYNEAIAPAIVESGLKDKRVDRDTEGGLLKQEILNFINDAEIIIADITNERPNCYLEIGYSMGVDKFRNLILTVREDHFLESPNHVTDGPKVHFDLSGYDILRWSPGDIPRFKADLIERIQRRRNVTKILDKQIISPLKNEWMKSQAEIAFQNLDATGMKGTMELLFSLENPITRWNPQQLKDAAEFAQIQSSGWPIGLSLDGDQRPKPRADGLYAEIHGTFEESYDYWAINREGYYYTLLTLLEHDLKPPKIFVESRINQATEALLFCARFFTKLGVDISTPIKFSLKFSGLKGRVLTATNMWRISARSGKSEEDEVQTEIATSLQNIESQLVDNVIELLDPFFSLFNFSQVERIKYEETIKMFTDKIKPLTKASSGLT